MAQGYFKLYTNVCSSTAITASGKLILSAISAFQELNEGKSPAIVWLARWCGMDAKTVQRSIAGLEKAGLLQVFRGAKRTLNHYKVKTGQNAHTEAPVLPGFEGEKRPPIQLSERLTDHDKSKHCNHAPKAQFTKAKSASGLGQVGKRY